MDSPNPTSKPPTQTTIDQQEQVLQSLPFGEKADFVNAERGLKGRMKHNIVKNADGKVVWNNDAYRFLDHDAPDSANPSLWRQAISQSSTAAERVTLGRDPGAAARACVKRSLYHVADEIGPWRSRRYFVSHILGLYDSSKCSFLPTLARLLVVVFRLPEMPALLTLIMRPIMRYHKNILQGTNLISTSS
ncbi:hypothetical protein FMEXI_10403 [Fusarium mexicanum]|uniref:Uncharacterized protein n=1 Tax=Fusarium mexicanum TaxID=751941 RepID=A0A8H5IFH4_9HYPO|nr:hypothetical protein FMEXI_10403 [Fusarium mexicanum]